LDEEASSEEEEGEDEEEEDGGEEEESGAAAEAVQQAAAEGLELTRSAGTNSGYKGVVRSSDGRRFIGAALTGTYATPGSVALAYIGSFGTAEEAHS
jgi:hypothetical protein